MVRFSRAACILGLILTTVTFSSYAQETSDGSLYSRFGLGTMHTMASSQAEAMGYAGTALVSPNYLSMANPASWSSQILTRFVGGFDYRSIRAVDAERNASRVNAGSIGSAAFSLPLLTNELGFAAGYAPITGTSYRVERPGVLQTDSAEVPFTSVFEGDGGLQSLRGGFGYRVTNNIRLGASADFVFGILQNDRLTNFEPGAGFTDTRIRQSTRLRGVTATVGGLVLLPQLLREDDYLSLGVSARLPTRLSGTRVTAVGEGLDRDTVDAPIEGDATLPLLLQGGLAYQASEFVTVSVDGLYAPWSQFSSDLSFTGFDPNGAGSFNNRWQLGAGLEYRPAGRNPNASYFERIIYRAGSYVEQSYIKPDPRVDLMQYSSTAGISLPTMRSGNRIDLTMEFGQRGTTDYDLVQDRFYRLSVVVNFGERWFVKRPIR